jgi:uncharacterized repeat protein (TIGR01451 family)
MMVGIGSKRAWLIASVIAGAVLATSSTACGGTAGWKIDSFAAPTNFSPSEGGSYQVEVRNAGSVASNGSPITITDTLPKGLTAESVELFSSGHDHNKEVNVASFANCTVTPVVSCELTGVEGLSAVAPDGSLLMVVHVSVDDPNASGPITNTATVSGGGALEASTSRENQISSAPPPFGPANFNFFIAGSDGASDTQAGDHPYELTTTIDFNSVIETNVKSEGTHVTSVQDPKDVVVDLPLGFVGSTLAAPQCTLAQLSSQERCPSDTVVGHLTTEPLGTEKQDSPIWNLTPERGVPAEFGFVDATPNPHVFFAHVVPTPAGYVLRVTFTESPQIIVSRIIVTFYGDPALRDASGGAQVPFFTDPTACSEGPLKATIWMDSWQHPGSHNADGTPNLEGDPNWVKATSESPAVTGCELLQFTPELFAQPTTSQADSPSGLEFELKLPQTEDVGVHATPALKDATVTLPEGMTVDPSAGNGLQACSVAQIGWLGGSPLNFSPDAPECPEASKIGSLEVETPLIAGVLQGAVYLARQNENPFGSVLAGYLVIDDPVTGVVLKIAGELKTDPHTGRITGVFDEDPQLPFSDFKLHFFGGPRGELATPESCGTFTSTGDLAPWSAPDSGPDSTPFDNFLIDEGCVSGFAPAFVAGSTNLQAGAFSPFVASISRQDTDQELAGATVSLPPGLSAYIKGVPLCPEAEANAGTCPEASQVGTVQAGAGPGPNPLFETGRAYLTGPYNGGAYGMSVVVPAIAGPFNFGNVVVRQSLRIDPTDAHVTDVSDPFPTVLDVNGANGQTDGIPIKLRRVDVEINRPGFVINPTSCAKLQVGGSITSTQGSSSTLATQYQVTNCQSLKFAPVFKISTSGRTSKVDGASLSVSLTYPQAAPGVYANIAKVKVDLPRQLPSRLTTLHGACLAVVFEANPAACPATAIVGQAKAVVPNLAAPLEGPAYFVSHGGEAFPSLTMVLQGNNVTIVLVGSTFIRKGITSSTFKAIPDNPVSSFQLTLPEGKNSALAANGNLCKAKLLMPTAFTAQNGAEIHQDTPITVTNCPKQPPAQKSKRKQDSKADKAKHKQKR